MPGKLIRREEKEKYLQTQAERESQVLPTTSRSDTKPRNWVKKKEEQTVEERGNVALARKKLDKLFGG